MGEKFGAWVGIIFSAVIFGLAHKQYSMPTQLQLIGLAIVIGYSRISRNGLLLPFILHSAAGDVLIIVAT